MNVVRQRADIIVPVFNAVDMVRDALDSLRRTLGADDRVIVIDDASTDVEVPEVLKTFARQATFAVDLERNPSNLGFVRTVNRGMAMSKRDVVLLNSDTVATTGWLDRIMEAAASDPRIATITPFSNNAEICSFPEFCRNNPQPPLSTAELIAASFADATPTFPDLPTGVGFCMYLRRDALDALGDFDAATFGRGYGEENDFCMRAAAHGWRNVLCESAYVVHRGGASFALTGERPGGEALRRLSARYPGYNALVAEFIRADPLASIRQRLAARLTAC